MTFTLDVRTDAAAQRATLRLANEAGVHLAAHEVALQDHPASFASLFDLRGHVRRMKRSADPDALVADAGTFLGTHVLGPEITGFVASGMHARSLLVRLPAAEDPLAARFARIPWEIARAPGDALPLVQRAVTVRAMLGDAAAGDEVVAPKRDEAVRVLLVFADPPYARPLAARLERERLRDLLFGEVLPRRNVEVDVLCHGVTRARLEALVSAKAGFHLVHWSGHGHVNALELADGPLGGDDLVALFRDAGGFVPSVMFLSACHSGAVAAPKDWESLRSGGEDGTRGGEGREASGFAGTALSLVRAGVKQVVAMRWEVGDVYARRLGRRFYRHLLADEAQHRVDKAVSLARTELWKDARRKGEYDAVDHATPMVFGGDRVKVSAQKRRSAQMDRREPKPQPLLLNGSRELDPPWGFVGRGEDLTRLFEEWMNQSDKPIALVQGLAGLGKTSLAAEVVHLGYDRFDYVFAFQAKGGPLSAQDFYRDLDLRLARASKSYRERDEMARVFVDATALAGKDRYDHLAYNLVDVMGAERMLLVLDNFETNLIVEKGRYECKDPAWTKLLEILSDRLQGTGSRVLITSRHKPTVLEDKALWMPLGTLPIEEARLYFQNHAVLRELWHGGNEVFKLGMRILEVSRGHPLILARIADLAKRYHDKDHGLTPAGRSEIELALKKIQGDGFKSLPDIFARTKSEKERAEEYKYLNDVAIGAVDLLIERHKPDVRRMLWMVTRAGEPAPEEMIKQAWGKDPMLLLGELCGAGLLTRDKEESYAFHELVAERAAEWMKSHPEDRAEKTEVEVWTAYGKWYGAAYKSYRDSGKPGARDTASEMGRRGIRYLVGARAYDSLNTFAAHVVTGTYDPALLGAVVADLQTVAGEVPAGEARWRLRTYLADAWMMAGQSDKALPLYAQAAEEAAGHWSHVGWICQHWASALGDVGQLDRARETYLRSAEAQRWAGNTRVYVAASEQEALRVDVHQGRAAEALPGIEQKVAEVRAWWAQHRQGRPVPEAPDAEVLARTLVGALDTTLEANLALQRWQPCLDLLGEIEDVKRALGTGAHEIARTRFNRYVPLMRVGNLPEAQKVLEGCLEAYRRAGNVTDEAKALSALAEVWDEQGEPRQALAFERQALALCERLPDPEDRAASHNNLAIYFRATGAPAAEALSHQLAALAYRLATGLDLRDSRIALADRIRESAAGGERFAFPPLAALLADPAFRPLGTFLQQHGTSPEAIQARIEAIVEEAR